MHLELARSDIGFGRVVVDDTGVTRRGAFGSDSIAWDDIRDYRLSIEFGGAPGARELMYMLDTEAALLVWLIDGLVSRLGGPAAESAPLPESFRLGIELVGESSHVDFNWRFKDVELAIAHVLERIDDRLTAVAHAQLAADGVLHAGPLSLTADEVRWGKNEPVRKTDVEAIELFDNSPVELRVMARGKVLPYGRAVTSEIPRLGGVLEIAHELGYRVRGRDLFRAFRRQPLPAARRG